ncbi:ferritin-like domain-containing protein [Streptomyces meridianus]|uniref:Ferritin-like protein n=1 Tax=Streptomyces meridianus TaxID=2938945 RepID=A0ABT0X692_9ACTN|nr:ferritin-like protein [Streptomyces meridianus]MCM2577202.1 ferritin-like protein [Streptomyces meridianus]
MGPHTPMGLAGEPAQHLSSTEPEINDIAGLHRALQTALALEHATIPLYLYALFSIKRGRNREIAEIIRSVVMEEMLHMALVGNILNAVGATPRIGLPDTVPQYPGPLPGGVQPGLVVPLRKCSVEQIRDIFLTVEQPHLPVQHHVRNALKEVEQLGVAVDDNGMIEMLGQEELDAPRRFFLAATFEDHTIGWFYQRIAQAIIDLDETQDLFTGDPARQVVWRGAPGRLYRVTDATTALWAVFEIIRQGEGTPTDPTTGPLPPVLDPSLRPTGKEAS